MIPIKELPIPNGWFRVAFSDEVPVGVIKKIHVFGQEMVVFRGESGIAGVLDAYCPHLGAHLGHGGCVVEDSIKCPFHAWRWDTSGVCVDIPYTERIIKGARIKAWQVHEVNGMIMVWYHDQNLPPFYEIPSLPEVEDPDWTSEWVRYSWELNSHPQEIMENAIDWPHFRVVHGMDAFTTRKSIFEEHKFTWVVNAPFSQNTLGSNLNLELHGENYGLGFNFTRYNGEQQTISVASITVIDPGRISFVNSVLGKKNGRSEADVLAELKAQMDEQAQVVKQDFEIWENKVHQEKPILCKDDGPIHEFRNWSSKFYSSEPSLKSV